MPESGPKFCPYCGHENAGSAKFCRDCGQSFPDLEEQTVPVDSVSEPVKPPQPIESGRSSLVYVAIAALLIALVGGLGFVFWSTPPGIEPTAVAQITEAPQSNGEESKDATPETPGGTSVVSGPEPSSASSETPTATGKPSSTPTPSNTPTPTMTPTATPTITPSKTPSPTPTPTTPSSIVRLALIHPVRNSELRTLRDGGTVDLSILGTDFMDIEAIVESSDIESVTFYLDGEQFCMHNRCVENSPPYSMAGDQAGNYYNDWDWSLITGEHTISVKPCTEDNGGGSCEPPVTIAFTIRE